jgi:hypothetical protein
VVQLEPGVEFLAGNLAERVLRALAEALAERLDYPNGSPWMNTAETAEYKRVSMRWICQPLIAERARSTIEDV